MDAAEYQNQAARTLIDAPEKPLTDLEAMAVWNALGLAGEAGEVADLVKKAVFHGHPIELPGLAEELGDVLWYVAALCSKFDLDLSEIMRANIEKLRLRYPEGFSSADSRLCRDCRGSGCAGCGGSGYE
jgi:NTP pyrophosphatase (non-canonical NTP hydrolase)